MIRRLLKKKIIYIIYFGCVLFFLLFFIIIQILKNPVINEYSNICLLYTSDAADEL